MDEGDFIRGFANLVTILMAATHIMGDKADFFYGRFQERRKYRHQLMAIIPKHVCDKIRGCRRGP